MRIPDYLKYKYDQSSKEDQQIFDHLYFDLSYKIYGRGDHFAWHGKFSWKNYASRKLVLSYKNIKKKKVNSINSGPLILSNAYHNFNLELEKLGYQVFHPPWYDPLHANYSPASLNIAQECYEMRNKISQKTVNEILQPEFFNEVREFKKKLKDYFSQLNFSAAFFPNDICFFESIAVSILKELKIASLIIIHGLPAGYSEEENRSVDYLLVWGDEIKKNYVEHGFKAENIFVSGHPNYLQLYKGDLRSDLSQVLVLGQSFNACFVKEVNLGDCGNLILYTEMIKNALRSLGVKKARLRPHPSMSKKFYHEFIDLNFFEIDANSNIKNSLMEASLVIGPISTSLVDAFMNGVNYLIFYPEYNGRDLMNYPITKMFGIEHAQDYLVAHDEEKLAELIKKNPKQSLAKMQGLLQEKFDLSFLPQVIAQGQK